MKKILIDTDVILDFFFDRQPHSNHAAILFSLCQDKKLKGFVTPVILSNTYYLLRQTAKHEKVINQLKKLLSITGVLTMDAKNVEMALKSDFKDFEDALQNSAAISHGEIEAIITRNVKDFRKSLIAVFTPSSFVEVIDV